ncbi:GNAT family N-acetyltransferase [Prevotella sp. 10(H)]|uniref:GNAT family N-acetyltransferase n=1 Tax=Prevotella sp. 10(H) TaxID=1158294 RepID=UPI00068BD7C1|nr:GNAT family N-acetyltransferase [Prevotella sp. 10(H)]
MPNSFSSRQETAHNIEITEIGEFSKQAFEAVRKLTATLIPDAETFFTESYFKEILQSDNSHLFLILVNKDIAGMLTLGIYNSPTGKKAWIEDVVVDESFQGKGLGRSIVQYAVKFAEEAGVDTLMLTSRPSRVAANKLYQSLDFVMKETNVYRIVFNNK